MHVSQYAMSLLISTSSASRTTQWPSNLDRTFTRSDLASAAKSKQSKPRDQELYEAFLHNSERNESTSSEPSIRLKVVQNVSKISFVKILVERVTVAVLLVKRYLVAPLYYLIGYCYLKQWWISFWDERKQCTRVGPPVEGRVHVNPFRFPNSPSAGKARFKTFKVLRLFRVKTEIFVSSTLRISP